MILTGLKITAVSMMLEDAGLLFGISSIDSGKIEKIPTILFCLVGILIVDSILYFFARQFVLPEKIVKKTDRVKLRIQNSKYKGNFIFLSILLSRFTPGLRYPTIITAGHLRTPFFKFISVDFVGLVIWDSFVVYTGLGLFKLFYIL